MALTRKQLSSCNTLEQLVELHSKAYSMQPDYNKGTSIAFAKKVIEGRNLRAAKIALKPFNTVKYFNEVD